MEKVPTKIDNLKRLIDEMDSKQDFVDKVANHYNKSYIYILQNWFQARWAIPNENIDQILSMAQKFLFEQTKKKRELLIETGYKTN